MILYNLIQLVIFVSLALATLYIFIFAIAGLFYRQPGYRQVSVFRKIAVLIPGYKEDEVIVEVAAEALLQDYPANKFDIIVIADSFLPATLTSLKQMNVKLIEVTFEKSTKAKALNRAMELLPEDYDLAVVLDADNVMETGFLRKINSAFERDISAVQGHRTAKNMDTSMAILDSVSEEINNHIFRRGHRVLGLSSAIIGSGMAFRYLYFKRLMSSVKAVGGFDKEIELSMIKSNHSIEYLDDAFVYDEKVQKAEVFSNQRRRWLSAQLHYFRKDFFSSLISLFTKGNIDYFDKTLQFIQPPRILLLGSVFISAVIFIILNTILNSSQPLSYGWIGLVTTLILAFMFSVPASFYNKKTLKAMASIPKGMLLMAGALLRIKGANKQFIHTKHSSTKKQVDS